MQPTVLSEVGLRENNEDAAFASPRLVAVADGVGGAASGEIASRLAILKMVGLDKRRLIGSLEREFGEAVADANAVIAHLPAARRAAAPVDSRRQPRAGADRCRRDQRERSSPASAPLRGQRRRCGDGGPARSRRCGRAVRCRCGDGWGSCHDREGRRGVAAGACGDVRGTCGTPFVSRKFWKRD
jgi:hypothetical protein